MEYARWFPTVALMLALLTGCSAKHVTGPPAAQTLSSVVEQARVRHGLPAIAAASFSLDSIDVAVSGLRRLGALGSATPADLFHVGSLAKGMTATIVGKLVDEGLLTWSLTLADAFPEFASAMDTAYREVTLAELLQNRAGVPGINDLEEFEALPVFPGDVTAQRLAFAGWLLAQPPATARGTYLYSTAGFSIAAAIAERRSGRTWDSMLRADFLDPLGASLFIGWPLEAGPNEPCGHMMVGSTLEPIDPSAGHIPAILAPAGDVSMTVRDYARYAQLHLRALCGSPTMLSAATWQTLHAPSGEYAMGWSVVESGGETVLTHTGSPATFFAFVALYKQQRHGVVVIVNATSPEVMGAIADIVTATAPGPFGRGALAALFNRAVR